MMMELVKVLIADDEIEARQLIRFYLTELNIGGLIGEADDGFSTLQSIQDFQPDILFLDIKMPGLSGIEVLEKRDKTHLPAIVFTTAFDEYALPAFDFDAVDYLLKPFGKERFQKAFGKAKNYVDLVKNEKKFISTITIKQGGRSLFIPVKDVLYFNAEGNYIEVFTKENKYLINQVLYELELLLDPQDFVRVHRSTIVNLHLLQEAISLSNGDFTLLLKTGQKIRASRTFKSKFKSAIG